MTLLSPFSVDIIKSPEEIDKILKKYSNASAEKEARKQLKANVATLIRVHSIFFWRLQDIESNLFYAELSNIMTEKFGATYKDYWVLNVTLPKRPEEPVVYVILKKNM